MNAVHSEDKCSLVKAFQSKYRLNWWVSTPCGLHLNVLSKPSLLLMTTTTSSSSRLVWSKRMSDCLVFLLRTRDVAGRLLHSSSPVFLCLESVIIAQDGKDGLPVTCIFLERNRWVRCQCASSAPHPVFFRAPSCFFEYNRRILLQDSSMMTFLYLSPKFALDNNI
jgi:hypothetical protein